MRSSSNSGCFNFVFALIFVLVIAIIVVAVVGFIFIGEEGSGVVIAKWVDTASNETCDRDANGNRTNCRTSTSTHYYVRLRDGRVYSLWHGAEAYTMMNEGQHIGFHARGFRWEPLGSRLFIPSITSYEVLEDTRNTGR